MLLTITRSTGDVYGEIDRALAGSRAENQQRRSEAARKNPEAVIMPQTRSSAGDGGEVGT